MGIFSFFSSKKEEKKPEEKKVVKEEQPSPGPVYICGPEDIEMLRRYADKDVPLCMAGGDFSGKKVFVVSKPTDITERDYQGRSCPVVTADRLSMGTFQTVTFIDDGTKELLCEVRAITKRRKDNAEAEKAWFNEHQYEPEFAPNRYVCPERFAKEIQGDPIGLDKLRAKSKAQSEQQKDKQTNQQSGKQKEQQKEQQPQLQPIQKPPVTNAHPSKEGQQNRKQTEQQKGQQNKVLSEQQKPENHSIKEFHFNDTVSEADTLVFKLNKLISTLPEYDFYNGDHDKEVSEDLPSVKEIAKLKNDIDITMRQAYRAEQACDWRNAAKQYDTLVRLRYWDPKPYIKLIEVYKKSKVQSDYIHKLESLTVNFFRKRREKMKSDVLLLADKYDSRIYAEKCINEGKTITYYDGLFDLYNPYNEIEELLLNLT